jgi:hypothetical protein
MTESADDAVPGVDGERRVVDAEGRACHCCSSSSTASVTREAAPPVRGH